MAEVRARVARLEADLAQKERDVAQYRSSANSYRARCAELEAAAEKTTYEPAARPRGERGKSSRDRYASELADSLEHFHENDIPDIVGKALTKVSKSKKVDFIPRIAKTKAFRPAVKSIYRARDKAVAKHLRERVYTPHVVLLLSAQVPMQLEQGQLQGHRGRLQVAR